MDPILHGVLVKKDLINFFLFFGHFFYLSHTFLDFQVTRNIEIKTCGLMMLFECFGNVACEEEPDPRSVFKPDCIFVPWEMVRSFGFELPGFHLYCNLQDTLLYPSDTQ